MNILYGIAGEGLGHATRSEVIIKHLKSLGHSVFIISSGKAFDFLEKSFPGSIKKIEGFSLSIENNELNIGKSIRQTLFTIPKKLKTNTPAFLIPFKNFKPDLVISDFESFTYLYAKVHLLPIIAIDNIHAITRCKLEIPAKYKKSFLFTKTIVSSKLPACNHYLISTFFDTEPKRKYTEIIPPILREEIINTKSEYLGHTLVYLSGKSYPQLIEILKKIPQKFIIYGFNKNETIDNIQFKEFSGPEFIEDLRSSSSVISTSGFSLMSESIYLKKPFLAIPLKNQFEQVLNAIYLKKMGFGEYHMEITEGHILNFLKRQKKYSTALQNYSQNGNKILFDKLENLLQKYN